MDFWLSGWVPSDELLVFLAACVGTASGRGCLAGRKCPD